MTTAPERVRWRVCGSAYVIAVGALAIVGFATSKTGLILLAGLAALPSSLMTIPAFYVAYGFIYRYYADRDALLTDLAGPRSDLLAQFRLRHLHSPWGLPRILHR